MRENKRFLLATLFTLIGTRITLFLLWNTLFMYFQKNDIWHHFYTGFILIVLSTYLPHKLIDYIQAFGLGLMIDELMLIPYLIRITHTFEYWSTGSYLTIVLGYFFTTIYIVKRRENSYESELGYKQLPINHQRL